MILLKFTANCFALSEFGRTKYIIHKLRLKKDMKFLYTQGNRWGWKGFPLTLSTSIVAVVIYMGVFPHHAQWLLLGSTQSTQQL